MLAGLATAPLDIPHSPSIHTRNVLSSGLAIILGIAMTLAIYGYRFGEGNHTIYLLDAIRRVNPALLTNDWFATHTLQYHLVFSWLVAAAMHLHIAEPAFLADYLLLVILFHVACFGIATRLQHGTATYLLFLVLYYASGAGTALGAYQFFQDSSLLASNIANVALLWAIYFYLRPNLIGSAACLGIAGLFHLNHAVIAILAWLLICRSATRKQVVAGSLLALLPSLFNILQAAGAKWHRSGSIPLDQFLDLYVRLRHPHHYDPSSWPMGIWLAFLWPLPLAMVWLGKQRDEYSRRMRHIFVFVLALQAIALITAGAWYFGESLVQLSLYRFSIYAQLLGCMLAAGKVATILRVRIAISLASFLCVAMIAACLLRGPFFGLFKLPQDDTDYLAVCDWARQHTPIDAVFLVPPSESCFRLRAQRAIIVNFKAVPQLSGELREWADRLQRVLSLDDLQSLPRGYLNTLAAIEARYASLTDEQLVRAAGYYNARFVVTTHPLARGSPLFSAPHLRFFLYDLLREEHQDGSQSNSSAHARATRPANPAGHESISAAAIAQRRK